ncbi:hypothetical protein NDU88_002671 [Pleurodeles waltl]|uniref:Uncharacterized protein n=1 Tax=Pleurodeles waltl TaxID=8319 RepID=A0AAV7PAQ4_PLEWA|nr:hypothetical protein NDU88_002671 [Pleurodeles waltl]
MCDNYQRLEHSAAFCHQKPKCVHCGGDIPPTNAPGIEKQNLQYVQTAQETTLQVTAAAPTNRKQKETNHGSKFRYHKRYLVPHRHQMRTSGKHMPRNPEHLTVS